MPTFLLSTIFFSTQHGSETRAGLYISCRGTPGFVFFTDCNSSSENTAWNSHREEDVWWVSGLSLEPETSGNTDHRFLTSYCTLDNCICISYSITSLCHGRRKPSPSMSQQYGNCAITEPLIIQNSVCNYSGGKYARNGLWPPAAPAQPRR